MAFKQPKSTHLRSEEVAAGGNGKSPAEEPSKGNGAVRVDALKRRAQRLEEDVQRLYADLIAHKQASGALPSEPERHPLKLMFELPKTGKPAPGSASLFAQLLEFVEDLARREAAFPRGHVYCHWCKSFICDHSLPLDPKDVFAGYTQTGEPCWREFAAILLEKRDPRIDHLYKNQPCPVTLFQDAEELTREQLAVYGKWSKDIRILGQVLLGYLRIGKNGNQASVAMCFQAVQAGSLDTPPVLNVVGTIPERGHAVEFLESQADPRITNALSTTRRMLRDLALVHGPRRRRSAVIRQKVATILQRLSRNLERIYRQRQRRTRHSEVRHLDRRRPAATAFRDALRADNESIFRDVEERTWVVIGPKNRVHIFNDNALHVTSVVYQGETIRQRTKHGKWLAPRGAELVSFREALERHGQK